MAKEKKETKEKPIEVTLWDAANKLRGSVEPSEYKHVVLSLIFLKFAGDKFEEHRAKLMAEMKRIQKDFKTLLEEEKKSQEQLINAFKTLGYEI